jgi:acyl-CoA dehydrogenase
LQRACDCARERTVFGGMACSKELPVERLFRDARIGTNIPIAEELILAHIGTQVLGLPRSC